MLFTLLLLQNEPVFTLWIPVNIDGLRNLTRKINMQSMVLPLWNNYCALRYSMIFPITFVRMFWPFLPPMYLPMLTSPFTGFSI